VAKFFTEEFVSKVFLNSVKNIFLKILWLKKN